MVRYLRWFVQVKSLYFATTVSLTCAGKKSLCCATTLSLTCTGKVPVRCNHNIRRNRRQRDAFTIRITNFNAILTANNTFCNKRPHSSSCHTVQWPVTITFFCLVTILPTKSERLLQAPTVSHGHHIDVRSWGPVVGTEIIGYGLNSRAIGVRFPTGAKYFVVWSEEPTPTLGPCRHFYSQRTEGSSPWGQAAKAWSWPITPSKAKVTVGRYLQLLSRLHGVYGGLHISSHTNKLPLLSVTINT